MKTVISTDRAAAVELLRKGETVGLPTETVYGLAVDALDPIAVAKIFEAKGRPRFDPLIVHLPDQNWLEKIIEPPTQDRQMILRLTEKFWPGPFTMVLRKRDIVPEIVTAGLETAAIRISAHLIFSEIVRALGKPLSAPGQLPSHYAPKTPLRIVDDLRSFAPLTNQRCALLAWNPIKNDQRFVAIRNLSEKQELREAAANLFRYLRELDQLDVDLIVAEQVPEQGLGAAILDRLQRASHA